MNRYWNTDYSDPEIFEYQNIVLLKNVFMKIIEYYNNNIVLGILEFETLNN